MTSARLLIAILLFLATWVFAQENQPATSQVQNPVLVADSHGPAAGSIPLRIDPLGSAHATVPQDPLARLESSLPPMFKKYPEQKVLFFPAPEGGFLLSPDLPGDTCLKIRSYVMKRDSKNSDATHLVGYSTCQPAKKFQLRSAVETPLPEK